MTGISLLRKSVRDFFRTKGFLRIFDGFFLQTKGFCQRRTRFFGVKCPSVFEKKLFTLNESRRVDLKFCLADFIYLIQELRNNCLHLRNRYARIAMPSAQFLNHIYKIRQTEI